MGPSAFDKAGLSNAYFAGTATKTNANKEMPSKKPTMRKRPTFVWSKCVILSEIRSVGEGRKRPGDGYENDEKGYGKPNQHGLEFFGISRFSFGEC